ncbi:unnamed protein product [Lepeophtheirus salmonis]|uniref:(salmon louse) hypothetical protein n=1 Tax=Lepeophtheirus salmonis TaxID=72036 RepID=A0A7R8CUD0_LEPSM|nr:unnamed protein product [Lepeophtheirus salmonis]CAF2932332.1 unnamed protein product [Lepeophtheirus salmonis]
MGEKKLTFSGISEKLVKKEELESFWLSMEQLRIWSWSELKELEKSEAMRCTIVDRHHTQFCEVITRRSTKKVGSVDMEFFWQRLDIDTTNVGFQYGELLIVRQNMGCIRRSEKYLVQWDHQEKPFVIMEEHLDRKSLHQPSIDGPQVLSSDAPIDHQEME